MPARVGLIEPMRLLRTDALPDDESRWVYQLKLDGYRAIAVLACSGHPELLDRARVENAFAFVMEKPYEVSHGPTIGLFSGEEGGIRQS